MELKSLSQDEYIAKLMEIINKQPALPVVRSIQANTFGDGGVSIALDCCFGAAIDIAFRIHYDFKNRNKKRVVGTLKASLSMSSMNCELREAMTKLALFQAALPWAAIVETHMNGHYQAVIEE